MIFIDVPYGQTILIVVAFILVGLIIFFLFYSFLSRWLAAAVTLFILAAILHYLAIKQMAAAGYILSVVFLLLAFIFRHKHSANKDPWQKQ